MMPHQYHFYLKLQNMISTNPDLMDRIEPLILTEILGDQYKIPVVLQSKDTGEKIWLNLLNLDLTV
jgi:hypothetical protein